MFYRTMRKLTVLAAALALLSLAGCDIFSGITVSAGVSNITIGLNTTAEADINLLDNGTPITTATVSINGINCPGNGSGTYSLSTPQIADDGSVALLISIPSKSLTINKTLYMPKAILSIDAPANLSTHSAAAPMTVSWTPAATDPNQYEVFIKKEFTYNGTTDYLKIISNSTFNFTIPATPQTLKSNQANLPINVVPTNSMSIAGGGVKIGSVFAVGNTATVLINTN